MVFELFLRIDYDKVAFLIGFVGFVALRALELVTGPGALRAAASFRSRILGFGAVLCGRRCPPPDRPGWCPGCGGRNPGCTRHLVPHPPGGGPRGHRHPERAGAPAAAHAHHARHVRPHAEHLRVYASGAAAKAAARGAQGRPGDLPPRNRPGRLVPFLGLPWRLDAAPPRQGSLGEAGPAWTHPFFDAENAWDWSHDGIPFPGWFEEPPWSTRE